MRTAGAIYFDLWRWYNFLTIIYLVHLTRSEWKVDIKIDLFDTYQLLALHLEEGYTSERRPRTRPTPVPPPVDHTAESPEIQ